MPPEPLAALQRTDDRGTSRWVTFHGREGVLEARGLAEVLPVLAEAAAARTRGLHAVGWIAYEAAGAFDPRLQTHSPAPGDPLARFTLFREQREGLPPGDTRPFSLREFAPTWTEKEFGDRVDRVREAISRGETYQVNLTYPWTGRFEGSARTLFRRMRLAQAARHQGILEESDRTLISASPERFFRLRNGRIECRPMKGTARPGEESPLRDCGKNRAENVMIVDMIRNDLGKVARPGTVETSGLFEIEPYPSLVQMTSTVTAEGPEDPVPWLRALFPCASITGAPKRNTMEIIRSLEPGPRGVYTGCMGGFFADGATEFNVAIRTLCIERGTGMARYGAGCGIVWDSDPAEEYRESRLKTAVLTHAEPEYWLLETLRAEPGIGCLNRRAHRRRLLASAAELGFEVDPERVDRLLADAGRKVDAAARVRVTLSASGDVNADTRPAPPVPEFMTFRIDPRRTPSGHPHLRHKTTRREIYTDARARCPDVEETLLVNERGECMEFTIGNLVIETNGEWLTPPRRSGLLPGTARAAQLENGVREAVLFPRDLESADSIYLVNAVRGRVRMRRVDSD